MKFHGKRENTHIQMTFIEFIELSCREWKWEYRSKHGDAQLKKKFGRV